MNNNRKHRNNRVRHNGRRNYVPVRATVSMDGINDMIPIMFRPEPDYRKSRKYYPDFVTDRELPTPDDRKLELQASMWIKSAEVWIRKAKENIQKHQEPTDGIVRLPRLKIANSCLTAAMACLANALEDMKLMSYYCGLYEHGIELVCEVEDIKEELKEIVLTA